MHNTILDLHKIVNPKTNSTLIHLTETKHINIKSVWRETLKEYKLIHSPPKLDPITIRRSAGTILAVSRDTYKDAIAIPTPSHLRSQQFNGHAHPTRWLLNHNNISLHTTTEHQSTRDNIHENLEVDTTRNNI
jgi:hypothetical protein